MTLADLDAPLLWGLCFGQTWQQVFDCLTACSVSQGMKGKIDEYSDSDEDQHDAYLERMKAEGKIREEGNDSDESESGSGE